MTQEQENTTGNGAGSEGGVPNPNSPEWPPIAHNAILALLSRVDALEKRETTTDAQEINRLLEGLAERQQRYSSVIQLVGYAGLFALWASTYQKMPPWLFGVVGGLILTSLTIYVMWELAMLWIMASRVAAARAANSGGAISPQEFAKIMDGRSERIHGWWQATWLVSVVTGVLAAAGLLGFYFTTAVNGVY